MTGWRPIETAPQDGTEVLIFCYGRIFIGSHHYGCWYVDDSQNLRDAPTHWRPLPPPPGEAKP